MKVGNTTYEGLKARAYCQKTGENYIENDAGVLKFSIDDYLTSYADNSYEIQSIKDMNLMNDLINEVGLSLEGMTFKVTAKELDFEKKPFMVGRYCSYDNITHKEIYKPFIGTFDGNGVIIKNLVINDSIGTYLWDGVGLFAYNKGIIKNVVVDKSCMIVATSCDAIGSIAAVNSGAVTGCDNNAVVSCLYYRSDGVGVGASHAGGIVGINNEFVSDCENKGKVSGLDYVGGIVGRNDGNIEDCNNQNEITVGDTDNKGGGIAGFNSGKVSMCVNKGNITGVRSPYLYYVDKTLVSNKNGQVKKLIK